MVADQDEVGVLGHAGILAGAHQLAQVAVMVGPGLVQIAAEHAVAMAVGVEGAGVDEQEPPGHAPG